MIHSVKEKKMANKSLSNSAQCSEPWNDPKEQPYIQIQNLTKVYGNGFLAVDNLSLDIYQGELFSLLGGSGCGKSTLLRMIAGFEEPTQGRILLDGQDLTAIPPHKRPVNMMFQSYALFPHMTVEQNIMFGLKQDKLPKDIIKKRTDEALAVVELEKFRKRKPHQLSGGQQQRVALARNLAKKPKIVLLDEPLGALDKKLRVQTQFELVNIQEELNMTFVMVTHDQEEAMTMSTRVGVMNQGRLLQVSTPVALYEYPKSKFVANFIGDVNIFEAYIAAKESDRTLIQDSHGNLFEANFGTDRADGEAVWLAVRPEKIVLSKATAKSRAETTEKKSNCLYGKVDEISYLGNVSIYHVALPDGRKVTVTRTNRQRDDEHEITWEDEVCMTWTAHASIILLS